MTTDNERHSRYWSTKQMVGRPFPVSNVCACPRFRRHQSGRARLIPSDCFRLSEMTSPVRYCSSVGIHMGFSEYGDYDGMGLAELVRKKQVSARELLDEAIARTARIDPQINAVVVKHYDYAERQIDNGLPDGPFAGVPFLLKDLDILEGTRTTSGASVYKDDVADHSSTLARRFLDAGVAIF